MNGSCGMHEPKRSTNGLPSQVSDRPVLDAATSRTQRVVGWWEHAVPPYAYVLASPVVVLQEWGADT